MAQIESGTGSGDKATVNANKQLFVTTSARNRAGVFIASSGTMNIVQAAHAATAGFLWLINPLASPRLVAIRRMEFTSVTSSTGAAAVATRVQIERVTFSGTSSGAQIAAAKRDTTDADANALLVSASTGLTLVAGTIIYSFFALTILTGVGTAVPALLEYEPEESGMVVLRPGEGIVARQPDAGVASDPRRFVLNMAWEEF